MKLFMKKTFLLVAITLFIFSCSEEEVDNNQSLEKATLSIAEKDDVVEVPSGLQTSDDPYAMQVNTWVQTANAMSQYFGYFEIPEEAEKVDDPIVPANGRANLTTEEYLVYKWTDPQSDYGVAYQVSQEVDKYIFQIFFKLPDDPNWYKYVEAEEQKDESAGSFVVYGAFNKSSSALLEYNWTYDDGTFSFNMINNSSTFEFEMVVNEETGAGEIKYYSEGKLDSYMKWDGVGNGSWKVYNSEGELDSEGSWTV